MIGVSYPAPVEVLQAIRLLKLGEPLPVDLQIKLNTLGVPPEVLERRYGQ